MVSRFESVALQTVVFSYYLVLLSSAFPSSPQRVYTARSIGGFSLFRANTGLKMSSQGLPPQRQEEEQYPMNPLDAYPESATDDEILEDLRMQNQISNDLWQSTHFRDNHGGDWIGSYNIFLPLVSKNVLSLRPVQSGSMKTVIRSDAYTKDQELASGGVEVEIAEEYTADGSSALDKEDPSVSALLEPVLSRIVPTEFRLACGNQVVGGAYTLVRKFIGKIPKIYLTEVAVRDGSLRVRARYLYTSVEEDNELKLAGVMVIREYKQGTPVGELKPILEQSFGSVIYDPQARGEPYIEVPMPYRTTLFFPKYLTADGRGVLTIQWEGSTFRFQCDRKFEFLLDGCIKSFELTEIRPENAGINYYS